MFFMLLVATAPITIAYDSDLAMPADKAEYESLLRSAVEQSWNMVSGALNVTASQRPLAMQVYSRERYAAVFGSFRSANYGAHYSNGKISVNGGTRINERFRAGLVHELTHTRLDGDGTAHRLPQWLNEGIAEIFEYDSLGSHALEANQIQDLKECVKQKQLVLKDRGWLVGGQEYLAAYAGARFLALHFGSAQMSTLVSKLLAGDSFEAGLGISEARFKQMLETWIETS